MADITKAQIKARIRLIRNGIDLYNQVFDSGKDTYTEYSQQRFVLGTSSGVQAVNLDGVSSAKKVLVLTDREILVALNNASYLVPVDSVLSLTSTTGITGIWVENQDANFTANVTVVVTD